MGRLTYLLDTNILSEPARNQPNARVMHYFAEKDGQYATAAIVWHELCYGCACLPDSKRKQHLQSYLATLEDNNLIILPYDQAAAQWFAEQRATMKSQGLTPAYADGEIAAIAAVNQLTLVTRNIQDFLDFEGLELANWFEG